MQQREGAVQPPASLLGVDRKKVAPLSKLGIPFRMAVDVLAGIVGVLIFCLPLRPLPAFAQRYAEITCEIEVSPPRAGQTKTNTNAQPRPFRAICIVGTNEWRIETDYLLNGKLVYFFDGTNVITSTQITMDISNPYQASSANQLVSVPFSEIKDIQAIDIVPSPDGHPLGDLSVNIPWLAFCSGNFLSSAGRGMPLPTAVIRHEPYSFAYDHRTQTFEDQLGLPRTMELFTSRERAKGAVWDRRLVRYPRIENAKLHDPSLPDNALAFRYFVDESTNFLGWNFPLKFGFVSYHVNQQHAGGPSIEGRGTVLSIRDSSKPSNAFVPGMRQVVADYRFRSDKRLVDSISYTASNMVGILPTNDPHLQRNFSKAYSGARTSKASVANLVRVLIVTCFTMTAVFLGVLIRGCKKHRNNQTSPKQEH